jgi:hypothetical protein
VLSREMASFLSGYDDKRAGRRMRGAAVLALRADIDRLARDRPT